MRGFWLALIALMISGTVGVGADVIKRERSDFVVTINGTSVAQGETPAVISVVHGTKNVVISFAKNGTVTQTASLGRGELDGWRSISVQPSGNLHFIVLDPDSSAAYELENAVIVSLPPEFKSPAPDQIRVIDISMVPDNIRGALRRI
jgi:hypothetical protein